MISLPSNKATGHDKVSMSVLKGAPLYTLSILTEIEKLFFTDLSFPNSLEKIGGHSIIERRGP